MFLFMFTISCMELFATSPLYPWFDCTLPFSSGSNDARHCEHLLFLFIRTFVAKYRKDHHFHPEGVIHRTPPTGAIILSTLGRVKCINATGGGGYRK